MTRCVSFVGPLPPPVNGFSNVCAMMLDRLRTRMPVEVFNRAPKLRARALGILQQLGNPAKYLKSCVEGRDVVLYLALSGGRGQLVDLMYVLISKLFRRSIFVHHHSFVYINSPSWLNRCLFSLVRNETHIVLSPKMGELLTQIYRLNPGTIRVVSNAAFYDADEAAGVPGNESAPLQLGFLSNITFEKGIVEFFGILEKLKQRGVAISSAYCRPVGARFAADIRPTARSCPATWSMWDLCTASTRSVFIANWMFLCSRRITRTRLSRWLSTRRCGRVCMSLRAIEGPLRRCCAMAPVSPFPGSTLWKRLPRTSPSSTMIGLHCWLQNACQCSKRSEFDAQAKLHWKIYWPACKARMNQ